MAEPCSSKDSPSDVYRPLDKDTREVRLMEILPSEDTNATVEIRLFRRQLEDMSGQFIPFSYVWGDPTDTKPIKVNGTSTQVTRNLADFLKQTRTLLPDILAKGSWDKPVIFWVDAICINQQNLEERNHQVQLMNSIYSSAPLVLAWLGHQSDAHLAVSLAESLDPSYCLESLSTGSNVNYVPWMIAHPHLCTVSEGGNEYWEALIALVQSPYWTRTWTFQEMVLPTNVLFICGSSLVKLQSIMATLQLVSTLGCMADHPDDLTTKLHQGLYFALQPFSSRVVPSVRGLFFTQLRVSAGPDYSGLTLVPELVSHKATDPRDKVYGLVGVMRTCLEVDYTKDTAQVYSEFVLAWLGEVKDLNFLVYAQEHDRIIRLGPNLLPSWAPDWEAISQNHGDIGNCSQYTLFLRSLISGYDAPGQLPASKVALSNDLSALFAPGVVAGNIEEVYPCWTSGKSDADIAFEILQLANKCTSYSGSPPGPRLHIFQTLFRTIISDLSLNSLFQSVYSSLQGSVALCFLVGVLAWTVDSERLNWHTIAAAYLPQLGIPLGQDFSRAWKEEIFKDCSAESKMTDWEDAATAMAWTWENDRGIVEAARVQIKESLGRFLKFVTNNGYLGITAAAQEGDLVVVLPGCKAPVLLRRKGHHYQHVGPCFVMGLMEGEAKQMVDQREARIEVFEIR